MMGRTRAILVLVFAAAAVGLAGANFQDECTIEWNKENAKFSDNGNSLTLSLVNKSSGCLLQTKKQFIFGRLTTLIKLVPGNSAGTVTTYYTSSVGDNHDEIDFEFLGNETGQPYTIHTNIFADGVGTKEMQFKPWFDPTDGYHNYTISWTPCMVVWYVDSTPIRVFRNYEHEHGIPFPTKRPMYGYSSIWNADDWATQGGSVKTDWSKAPFVASYHGLDVSVCECPVGVSDCATKCASSYGRACPSTYGGASACTGLSGAEKTLMLEKQDNYRIYDYCVDPKAYKNGTKPVECTVPQY